MKLVSFSVGHLKNRVGIQVGEKIYDVNAFVESELAAAGEPFPKEMAALVAPSDMRNFLTAGDRAMAQARALYEKAIVESADCRHVARQRSEVRLEAPVTNPDKVIGLGQNYKDFCDEIGMEYPKAPRLFAKFTNAVCGPEDPIIYPPETKELGYEAELGLVIGKAATRIEPEEAYDYIAGYMCLNDISASDVQAATNLGGKTFDNFCPCGPWLVTPDEVGDPANLDLGCWVNGKQLQKSNTNQLIFDIPNLVAYLSKICTLLPGDIIATGTPGGLAKYRKPPAFMVPGDVCTVKVEGLGTLENRVVALEDLS